MLSADLAANRDATPMHIPYGCVCVCVCGRGSGPAPRGRGRPALTAAADCA